MRALTLSSIFVLMSAVSASDWSQFRGGTAGRVDAISHPQEWSEENNLAWAMPMKGTGWSSPVVVGERIFLTAAIPEDGSRPKGMMAGVSSMGTYRSAKPVKHTFIVRCLSLKNGEELWSRIVDEKIPPVMHPSNTYATESPATDGRNVFTFFANTGTITAWNLEGEQLWQKNVGTYKSGNGFGTGSSLAIAQGKVFIQNDNDEQSFVVAYDALTGDEAWRDERQSRTSWSTPLIWGTEDQPELVTCGSGFVKAYEPSTGKVLWEVQGVESSFSSSPSIGTQAIFFGNSGPGSAGPLVAVKRGTRGSIQLDEKFESDAVEWSRTKSGPGMASPVVSRGHLYIPGSGGILNCYAENTGERIYRTRVPKMATVASSLWADDDHVFILDESGTTHVIQSGPDFKVQHANQLNDLFWSTPAIAGDNLLLRGVEKLYCIRKP